MKNGLTRSSILKTLADNRESLKSMGVRRIGLFGSYLKGTQTKKSDLDFLIVLERVDFDSYMDVKFLLEKLFGRKVDLVMEKSLKPALRNVLKDAAYATGF